MKRILILIVMALVLIGAALSGCTGQGGTNNVKHDERISKLVIGTTDTMGGININDNAYGRYRQMLTHQGFARITTNGSYVPDLTTGWETSADLKTWTFHLLDNATWDDGVPLTAGDVKFTIEYTLEKFPSYKYVWGVIESIDVPDDHTVVLKLNAADGNLISDLQALKVLPQHIFKDVADPKTYNDIKATIGCGPYKFVSYDKDAGILTFTVNDKYWGAKPNIDTIEIRMFKNPDTMIMALQKGEIDVTYIYGSGIGYYYVPKLLANDNMGVMTYENTWNVPYVLFFNTNLTPYDNVQFREAVSYAIDYDEINNLMTAGYGTTPNAGFVPDSFAYYADTRALARDVNKSRSMLDNLGYVDKDGDGFREAPDGHKFAPELLVINYPDDVRLAGLVKKYFNSVGLDIIVDVKDEDTAWDILDVQKTYDMALTGSGNVGAMYAADIVDTRYYGWAMVDDPAFTAIVDRFLGTADEGARKQAAIELQNYYSGQYPIIALYWDQIIQPYNKKYEGYVPNPKHGVITYGTLYGLNQTV